MKRLCFVFSLAIMALASCQKEDPAGGVEWVYDRYPCSLAISVEDAKGNDLLDSAVVGNIVSGDLLHLTYKEKDYPMKWSATDPITVWYNSLTGASTRAIFSEILGYYIINKNTEIKWELLQPFNKGKNFLFFGEIDAQVKHPLTDVTLHWADGSKDVISFEGGGYNIEDGKPKDIPMKFYLNGKENETSYFTIIK